MGEIPEDVAKAARDAVVGIKCFPPSDLDAVRLSVARAILAERQRCAEVTSTFLNNEGSPPLPGDQVWLVEAILEEIVNPAPHR